MSEDGRCSSPSLSHMCASRMAPWDCLNDGDLLEVEWEGDGKCKCKLIRDGESHFVRSADNRFSEVLGFSPDEDTWTKLRQTCSKDLGELRCPACNGRGSRRKCCCASWAWSPPGWHQLCSNDHRRPCDDSDDPANVDSTKMTITTFGRTSNEPVRCAPAARNRAKKKARTPAPPFRHLNTTKSQLKPNSLQVCCHFLHTTTTSCFHNLIYYSLCSHPNNRRSCTSRGCAT